MPELAAGFVVAIAEYEFVIRPDRDIAAVYLHRKPVDMRKQMDGLPLYRQERQFRRLGVELNRATMANWMIRIGEAAAPMVERLHAGQSQCPDPHGQDAYPGAQEQQGADRRSRRTGDLTPLKQSIPSEPAVLFVYLLEHNDLACS